MGEQAPGRDIGWCWNRHLLDETHSMTHRNSPLAPAGKLRLGRRVEGDGRPLR